MLNSPCPNRSTAMTPLPATGMQKVEKQADGSLRVTVARLDHGALKSASRPKRYPAEVEPFLRASLFANHKDPEVRKLAKKAAGEATKPWEVTDKLRRFVTEYVTEKTLNVGFATASEVARSKEGDCSEHAVLLAALARGCGLPSRAVAGLVFVRHMGGKHNVFGYHLWTQVYIAGKWVDVDAALRQTDCDPTHIALAVMSLNDEGVADAAVSLLPLIGQLEIDVVSVAP